MRQIEVMRALGPHSKFVELLDAYQTPFEIVMVLVSVLNCVTVCLALRSFINKLEVTALLKSEQCKWLDKFRPSNTVHPGIAFTTSTNQFHLPKDGR